MPTLVRTTERPNLAGRCHPEATQTGPRSIRCWDPAHRHPNPIVTRYANCQTRMSGIAWSSKVTV